MDSSRRGTVEAASPWWDRLADSPEADHQDALGRQAPANPFKGRGPGKAEWSGNEPPVGRDAAGAS